MHFIHSVSKTVMITVEKNFFGPFGGSGMILCEKEISRDAGSIDADFSELIDNGPSFNNVSGSNENCRRIVDLLFEVLDEEKEVVARPYHKGVKLEPGTSMNTEVQNWMEKDAMTVKSKKIMADKQMLAEASDKLRLAEAKEKQASIEEKRGRDEAEGAAEYDANEAISSCGCSSREKTGCNDGRTDFGPTP
jgi:hypothetical protein